MQAGLSAAAGIKRVYKNASVTVRPLADGGEGTVDALVNGCGGRMTQVQVTGPVGRPVVCQYGIIDETNTAIIEMSGAAGITLVNGEEKNPLNTTTYGVGEVIKDAIQNGCRHFIVGIGGSATNDGGCGAAAAVGVKFYRATGESFVPVGGTLKDIHRIDTSGMDPAVRSIPILTMCDIDNPLCGSTGASAVFGPQKGADAAMVRRLDDGLRQLAALLERDVGRDVLNLPGGGAAGGFGAGAAAFFASPLQMGIDVVLALTDFDRRAADAALVITGEGRLDSQSLRGKVVVGVARRAKALGVPVAALVGGSDTDVAAVYGEGVSGVFPINPLPQPFSEVRAHCRENLRFTAENLMRFYHAVRR